MSDEGLDTGGIEYIKIKRRETKVEHSSKQI